MSVSIYMKGYYEDFCGFGRRKNKANSKPILTGMRAFDLRCKRLPRPFGPRNDIRISDPLCLSGFVAMSRFEKANPIYSYCVMCDAYCEKEFEKTNQIIFSPQIALGVEKTGLSCRDTGQRKMPKLQVPAGESNRMGVKICRKLEFSAKSWYFIGN